MKKIIVKGAVLSLMLITSLSAQAQIDLGSIAKGVLSSATGSSDVSSAIGSILNSSKAATSETILGTWVYSEPAIVFESSNLLKQAGGKLAASAIENKLSTQLQKAGFTKGKYTITFNQDGSFTSTNGDGTYTLSGSSIKLSFLSGAAAINGTTQIDNGQLTIAFDSSKLLKFASAAGKVVGNSTLSTISSIAGSYDGMKTGMKFTKKVVTTTATTTAKQTTTTNSTKKTTKKVARKTTKKKTTKK